MKSHIQTRKPAVTFDPNDPRPLRIMIFPDKPQTILIHVPEGQSLWLPSLATPFDLDVICQALNDRDVPHVTTEGDPGRWWRNASQQEDEETAKRLNQQKHEEVARRVRITTSPNATTIEKQRAELMLEKVKADEELRQLKAEISKVKANAYTSGTYLPPLLFQTKRQRLADLQTVSLALQGRLGELRQQQKMQNVELSNEKEKSRQDRFIKKAKRYLSRDQFLTIWAEVNAEDGEDDEDDEDDEDGEDGEDGVIAVDKEADE